MDRSGFGIAVALVAATIVTFGPASAVAQLRRSGGPPPGEAPPTPPTGGVPRGASTPRSPFAGAWEGSAVMKNGPGANQRRPLTVSFDVVDSAKNVYSGATIHPNNARAPHLETVVRGSEMQWKQQNSGGGYWVYAARLVSADSIEGSFALRDWPQLQPGEKAPTGTFVLVRRRPVDGGR